MATDLAFLTARIRSRIQFASTSIDVLDVDICEWLNEAQERMVQTGTEWRSLEQTRSYDWTAVTDGQALPDRCIKAQAVFQIDPSQTDPSLVRIPIHDTTRHMWVTRITLPDTSRTFPQPSLKGLWYYIWAGKLYVVPPSGTLIANQPVNPATPSIKVELDYYGAPDDLQVGATTPPGSQNYFTQNYPRTLLWGALATGLEFLEEDDLADRAEARFQMLLTRAQRLEKQLKTSGAPKRRGL